MTDTGDRTETDLDLDAPAPTDPALRALLADVAAAPAAHAAASEDLLVGRTLGRFVITARLGKGGMGVVYRARDPELRRDVAIKVLPADASRDEERRARFLREARAAAGLTHAHIAAIYDVGFDEREQLAFIAMELIDGEELRSRLRRGPVPVADVEQIARQVARGLARAHSEGIVHRDLKPENVMVTADGDVKILDFGLAKTLDPAKKDGNSTVEGTIMGTPGYMAPEQVRGERVDARADVFSFGVLLYELLAGRAPFTGPTPMATAMSAIVDTPRPLARPDAAALVALITRCLEKERDKRPQNGKTLVDLLGLATTSGPLPAAPSAPSAASAPTPTTPATAATPTAPRFAPTAAPFSPTPAAPTTGSTGARRGLVAAVVVVVVVIAVIAVAVLGR